MKIKNKNSYLMQNVTPTDTPDTPLTLFDSALFWTGLGISVIPVIYKDKKPNGKLLPDFKWEVFQSRLPSYTELIRWFGNGFHNLGIVTGWKNLVVVDFDDYTQYVKWQLWLARRPWTRIADLALQVRTGRGVHVYFTTQIPAQNAKLDGIDVKARNGYVLGAGSVHPSGAVYAVMSGRFPALIGSLSDVLPADLLITHIEYPDVVNTAAMPVFQQDDDPWQAAEAVFNPTEDLIVQIKKRYRIEQFLKIDDRSNRRWLMTRCPFHDDNSPSFWVDSARQLCGCFAGCTPKPYDVIDLYARLHGLTVRDAILVMVRGVI